MSDETALPRLPPLTDGDLAATEVSALRGAKFGWREVLRLVRDLRRARGILRRLEGSFGAQCIDCGGYKPGTLVDEFKNEEGCRPGCELRAFLGETP